MNRITEETNYWNKAAKDPEVDKKYIADVSTPECLAVIGKSGGKVLEIGCGVGRLMADGNYGIDSSEEMLKIARKRKPNCHFKLSDGRTIPYDDNTFDFAYCMLVFQHIPFEAVTAYISEVKRVLKKGGLFRFQFIEGNEQAPFSKHHSLQELMKHVESEGFHVTSIERALVHKQWTWVTIQK